MAKIAETTPPPAPVKRTFEVSLSEKELRYIIRAVGASPWESRGEFNAGTLYTELRTFIPDAR